MAVYSKDCILPHHALMHQEVTTEYIQLLLQNFHTLILDK